MILRPPNLPTLDDHDPERGDCPSLIDLASLCEGRLTGEALERIEVHVARCRPCFELVQGLRAEANDIVQQARLVLVPAHVLDAAMRLREGESAQGVAEVVVPVRRAGRLWITGARRGLAAAAMLGIVVGGYHVGRSFTVIESINADVEAEAGGLTFGLLEMTSSLGDDIAGGDDEGLGLFAVTLKEGQS